MHQISNEKFGLFVTELRKKKNLTQKDLAEKLYVSDMQFTMPSGLHSVLERPFSEANGRPFLVKRSPLIVC